MCHSNRPSSLATIERKRNDQIAIAVTIFHRFVCSAVRIDSRDTNATKHTTVRYSAAAAAAVIAVAIDSQMFEPRNAAELSFALNVNEAG